jgi:2'-5' RNA ligase
MRTFLCIPIDRSLRTILDELSRRARRLIPVRASWVKPENFHVTVRFLGEIDPMLTIDLERACKTVTRDTTPFDLSIDRVGAFPTPDRPRVLWAGGDAPPSFTALLTSLDRELAELGFSGGRPETVAHITLARIKGRTDPEIAQTIRGLADSPDWTLRADRLVLMESRLTAQGAIYTPLLTLPFSGRKADGF